MPKLEYFLVCESVSIDQETNRVSLFNVIEDIQPIVPAASGHIIAQMVAVSCWVRQPGDEEVDLQATLRLHGTEDRPKDFPLNFRMDQSRVRLTFRLQGVPAASTGALRFELLLNGEHRAEHIVTVHPASNTDDTRSAQPQESGVT